MGKFKISWIKFLTVFFLFSLSLFSFAEPYYRVTNLNISAEIKKDGSVDVAELVEYEGYDINGILYNIDYKGYGDLKNLQIFYEKESEFFPARENKTGTGAKGTYELKDRDGLAEIKFYFPMREEKKWFLFTYTLSQGVTVYKDIAQFNRKMVGEGWQTI